MANYEIKVTLSKFQEISCFYGRPKYVHDIINNESLVTCLNAVTLRFGNGSPLEAANVLAIPYTEYNRLAKGTADEITHESYKKLSASIESVYHHAKFGMSLDGIDKAVQVRAHRVFSKEEKAFWQAACIDLGDPEYIPTFKDVENHFSVDKDYSTVVRTYKALLASRGIDNIEIPFSARVLSILIDKAKDGRSDAAFARDAGIPYLTLRRYTHGRSKSVRYDIIARIAEASGKHYGISTELMLAAGIEKDDKKTKDVSENLGWYQTGTVDKAALSELVRSKVSDYLVVAEKCKLKEKLAESIVKAGDRHISKPTVNKLSKGLGIPKDKLYKVSGYEFVTLKTYREYIPAAKSNVVVASKKPENIKSTSPINVD